MINLQLRENNKYFQSFFLWLYCFNLPYCFPILFLAILVILFFFFFFLFRAAPAAYGRSQARGWIRAAVAWGNVRSLTHWARPGIKPTSSWTVCQVLNLLSHNGNFLVIILKHIFLSFNLINYINWFLECLANLCHNGLSFFMYLDLIF